VTMVFFNEDKFNGHKQACRQIMTQHGDGDRCIANDQSQSLPSDADFLDPCAVIKASEQCKAARPYMGLNFFSERVPAFKLGRKLVNRQRFVAYIGEEGRQYLVEAFIAIEPEADAL